MNSGLLLDAGWWAGAGPESRVEPVTEHGFQVGRPLRWVVDVPVQEAEVAAVQAPPDFGAAWWLQDHQVQRSAARVRFQWELVPFESGEVPLPPVNLLRNGQPITVEGPQVQVQPGVSVPVPAPPDPSALESLAAPDPEPVAVPSPPRFEGALWATALTLGLLLGLGMWWMRRRRGRRVSATPIDPVSEAQTALQMLQARLQRQPPETSVDALHRILRRFLAQRFAISEASTLPELRDAFSARDLTPETRLFDVLRRQEAIRYGAAPVDPAQLKRDVDWASRWTAAADRPHLAPAAFVEMADFETGGTRNPGGSL